uniref:Uncharacterized protein n=1 Tax=Physcomitrium patens TaxID=3218 RepID=A0A2K1J0U2_PHYPA|nr:hypothetical protein PHYPA_023040 [Physcomitrium patens]
MPTIEFTDATMCGLPFQRILSWPAWKMTYRIHSSFRCSPLSLALISLIMVRIKWREICECRSLTHSESCFAVLIELNRSPNFWFEGCGVCKSRFVAASVVECSNPHPICISWKHESQPFSLSRTLS